jgi:prolyl oligopeptidase
LTGWVGRRSIAAMTNICLRRWLTPVALIFVVTGTLGFALLFGAQDPPTRSGPPATRTDDVKDNYFGTEVADPYRWLEAQQSPETRKWIDEQNGYTRSVLDPLPGRDKLKKRLTELLNVDAFTPPVERNGRYFFEKRAVGQDQFVLYLRKGRSGTDEVLVDPQPLSADHTVSVQLEAVSEDGKLLAYAVRQGGEDQAVPHFFDVDARKDLPERLPKERYFSLAITPDNSKVFYARMSPEGPRVYAHKVGSDPANDALIFGEGLGKDKIVVIRLSEDGRTLVIFVLHSAAGDRMDVYMQSLAENGPIIPVVKDIAARFVVLPADDRLFIYTNWKAPKGRVLVTEVKNPSPEHWQQIIPEGAGTIEDVVLTAGRLAVLLTENAASRARVYEGNGRLVREISLPAIGSISGFRGRWGSHEAFYEFESFHIPPRIYQYDVETGTQQVWAQPKVPFDSSKYEVKQVWYKSKDGTRVPMFLTAARGARPNGSTPTLLFGYGGFEVSLTPRYSARVAAWIESGGLYASANLRGGSEFGEEWHRAGMLEKKQNVFDDFIGAAEWLVQNHYTQASRLAIRGGSNGGLLVTAALTQRPDLFGAVLCEYPLIDMLRYQKFLVAQWWVPEYGSSDNAEQFKYIYAYSPYQHFKPGTKYPAVLFVTGDSDTRVAPLHARKMTALMQSAAAPGRPILLRYDTAGGHTFAEPVSKQVEEIADQLSFLDWQLKVPTAQ